MMCSASRVVVCLLVVSCLACGVWSQTSPPVWPQTWHANVWFAESLDLDTKPATSYSAQGHFYYDNTSASLSFHCDQANTDRSLWERVLGNEVYVTDEPTGKCHTSSVSSSARFAFLSPDFLSTGAFKQVGKDYLQRGNAFLETLHFVNAAGDTEYWHAVETDSPFRLLFLKTAQTPVVMEFSRVVSGFEDLANPKLPFMKPSSCSNATTRTRGARPHHTTPNNRASTTSTSNGTAWPLQWHGAAAFTGSQFGLVSPSTSMQDKGEIGEPTVVPFELVGHYYYDWSSSRECNVWTDPTSSARTKTLIVNSTYYLVDLFTLSCSIVPISPVNGPLKPDWPTHLSPAPASSSQFLTRRNDQGQSSFIRSSHFMFDAFNVGPEHSFNYWQSSDGAPLQFQGPVLEIWPYGQSFSTWDHVTMGLNGVDLDDVFALPSDCKPVLLADLEPVHQALVQWRVMITSHLSNHE